MAAPGGTGRNPTGLFVGLTTVDIIFSLERFPSEDTKNTSERYAMAAGGPASNAAVAFAYLGGSARLVSALGTSDVAEIAKTDLARCQVDHLELAEERSSDPAVSAIAVATESGTRTIITSPAIGDDVDEIGECDAWLQLVDEVDVVLLDGHEAKAAEIVARRARAAGTPVVIDGDLYHPRIEPLLPFVDVAVCGKSFVVPDVDDTASLFGYLTSRGVREAAATDGGNAIRYVSSRGEVGQFEVERVEVVDTLAAGDFFHGAFCYALARGLDMRRALSLASGIAGRSVGQFGTRAWMQGSDSASVA